MMNAIDKPIEQPLGRKLSHIGKDFLSLLHTNLKHIDLERNYYALLIIGNANGNITQQELATQLNSDKVSVVRIIDYLTEMGYVMRIEHEQDRRKYCLTLTDKAQKVIYDIRDSIAKVNNQAYSGLTEAQIQEFNNTLSVIQKNLKQ